MNRTLTATAGLLLLLSSCSSRSIWTEGPFEEVKARAADEDKLILVDFYSPG